MSSSSSGAAAGFGGWVGMEMGADGFVKLTAGEENEATGEEGSMLSISFNIRSISSS